MILRSLVVVTALAVIGLGAFFLTIGLTEDDWPGRPVSISRER